MNHAKVFFIAAIAVFSSQSLMAQVQPYGCENRYSSPIQCGFYLEGYQDGLADAQSSRVSDYKRFRAKYDRQYESYYRNGYESGYSSLNGDSTWNLNKRSAYDRGFENGKDDKNRRISRLPERYEGQYDRNLKSYFDRGYFDGYDGNRKQYDQTLDDTAGNGGQNWGGGNRPNPVTRPNGTIQWSGSVDDRVNLVIQGNTLRIETIAGRSFGDSSANLPERLPRKPTQVDVVKQRGRGSAKVVQQPDRANGYTAIIQIDDTKSGADNYNLDINWQAEIIPETYNSGSVRWRGRVDDRMNIRITGDTVESAAISGRGIVNESVEINGYLGRLAGTVSVRKVSGRGNVFIIEQPNSMNDYTAVIQVYDNGSGDGDYDLEISW